MGPDHGSGHSGRPAESPFQQDAGCSYEQQKKLRPFVEGFLPEGEEPRPWVGGSSNEKAYST